MNAYVKRQKAQWVRVITGLTASEDILNGERLVVRKGETVSEATAQLIVHNYAPDFLFEVLECLE
jgi:hypothetical protein